MAVFSDCAKVLCIRCLPEIIAAGRLYNDRDLPDMTQARGMRSFAFRRTHNLSKGGGSLLHVAHLFIVPGVLFTGGCICLFTFKELCGKPVGPADYIALADAYHSVAISGVPIVTAANRPEAYRFMILIDVLYEHRCGPPGFRRRKHDICISACIALHLLDTADAPMFQSLPA